MSKYYLSNKEKTGFTIEGLKENPYVISENENPIIHLREDDTKILIREVINKIQAEVDELDNLSEPLIENRSDALNRELNELSELLENFSLKLTETRNDLALEQEQLILLKQELIQLIRI